MIRNLQHREAEGARFVQPEQGKAEGGSWSEDGDRLFLALMDKRQQS